MFKSNKSSDDFIRSSFMYGRMNLSLILSNHAHEQRSNRLTSVTVHKMTSRQQYFHNNK